MAKNDQFRFVLQYNTPARKITSFPDLVTIYVSKEVCELTAKTWFKDSQCVFTAMSPLGISGGYRTGTMIGCEMHLTDCPQKHCGKNSRKWLWSCAFLNRSRLGSLLNRRTSLVPANTSILHRRQISKGNLPNVGSNKKQNLALTFSYSINFFAVVAH